MYFPEFENLSVFEVQNKISKLDTLEKPQLDFLYTVITKWQQSKELAYMKTAQEYYKNNNDIKDRVRTFIDRGGTQRPVENLSNTRLSHPFMRLLTDQKINYLLSKPFSIKTDDDNYLELLSSYLDKSFHSLLKNTGRDAIVNGIGWVQVYYDDKGKLCLQRIPSNEILPFWEDAEHTKLNAIIRMYSVLTYGQKGEEKLVNHIDYYTNQGTWHYILDEDSLKEDSKEAKGHFTAIQQDKVVQMTWDKIPFIAFKYNSNETSLLKWVKSLIDDYDITSSDLSNNLQDVPNSIKVVRAYDGTDKGEFVHNLSVYRTAFVDHDGDVTALNTPLDTTAIDTHLNRLRHDIFDAGNGVDTQSENLGNASGIALKYRYSNLDNDVSEMATEFNLSIQNIIWFINQDISLKNSILYDENTQVDIIFNTDFIINEAEVITMAKDSVGIISDETIIANHPWTTNVKDEQDKITKQKEEAIKMQQEMFNTEYDNQVTKESE